MENGLVPQGLEQKLRSFWDRPEGKVGMFFMALLGVGGIMLFAKILPWLILFTQNLITFILMLTVAGALLYVLLDRKFWIRVGILYKVVMRKLTGLFITLDPIAVLKTRLQSMSSNLEKMNASIGKLKGVMRQLTQKIEENAKTAEQSMSIASHAKTRLPKATDEERLRMMGQIALQTRKAGRRENSNIRLTDLHQKMELMYRVLSKMYQAGQVAFEDTADEIEQREAEWKSIQAGWSAMQAAGRVINGDRDEMEVYQQTIEIITERLGQQIGEMERFTEISQSFMDGVDLQNGMFEARGLDMLQAWEKRSEEMILLPTSEKKLLIAQSANPDNILNFDSREPELVPRKTKYERLIN